MVGKGKNKFAEATHAAQKGKAVVGALTPSPKQACRAEEVIFVPPPSSPTTTNEQTTT